MAATSTPSYIEEYTRKFTSYSGCDIHAVFNGRPIAELQQVTVSVRREKGPIFTCGSPNPRCFARGKRGIAGTLVFTTFDRDALLEEMRKNASSLPRMPKVSVYAAESNLLVAQYKGIDDWNALMQSQITNLDETGLVTQADLDKFVTETDFEYADQLFPFTITIAFKNEYGSRSRLDVLGVEILNESMSMGVDDLALEKVYTYVALGVKPMRKGYGTVVTGSSSNEVQQAAETSPEAMIVQKRGSYGVY